MSAGSVQTRGGRYRRLRERVEGENLGTGAPPEFRAGGGSGSRGPQASHGVEMVARVAHSFSAVQRVRKNAGLQRGGASYIVKKGDGPTELRPSQLGSSWLRRTGNSEEEAKSVGGALTAYSLGAPVHVLPRSSECWRVQSLEVSTCPDLRCLEGAPRRVADGSATIVRDAPQGTTENTSTYLEVCVENTHARREVIAQTSKKTKNTLKPTDPALLAAAYVRTQTHITCISQAHTCVQ